MKRVRKETISNGYSRKREAVFSAEDLEIILSEIEELQGKSIRIQKASDGSITLSIGDSSYVFE